jgi:flagellar L-ring protein precursor FlgH
MRSYVIKIILSAISIIVYNVSATSVFNLYSDHRAVRTDDILTVMIFESAKAGSQSKTNTSKENSMGLQADGGSGKLSFLPAFGVNGANKVGYDGKGATSREGNLVATVTTRVVKVLDNGNLVIEGSKVVEINEEKEIIKISGVVRPEDIQKNNMVYSSSIADAQITYTGKGVVNTGHRPGVIARFINWIF